jgi:hypothetical protein
VKLKKLCPALSIMGGALGSPKTTAVSSLVIFGYLSADVSGSLLQYMGLLEGQQLQFLEPTYRKEPPTHVQINCSN